MVAIHIFDSIGIEHNYVLDIGTYSIHRSNVTPIMDEYDIKGLLFDGQNKHKEPELVKVWLEEDSIEQILVDNNCPKNLDYISIDIDNMDYWILKRVLKCGYDANLIIVEFNPLWSYNESFTKIYNVGAKKTDTITARTSVYGASLLAFVNLLTKFNYRLIHVLKTLDSSYPEDQPSSNNALFIKSKFDYLDKFENQEDVIKKLLPEPFVEGTKMKRNSKRFNVVDLKELKEIFKEKFFVEV